ncbi:hypothetical protein BT96DRAFT_988852 [Gymnopus androsaceus JB14]|uniref:Uncharacterized protein n=1 Tax=Gymnopus androsaceus JB14 TaxID=1447944 RepID=A0A6A4I3A7_9AGAR|nr:hypothetical protein BT96DRAFT_988852 [Gymnopus androsaceus JB14]
MQTAWTLLIRSKKGPPRTFLRHISHFPPHTLPTEPLVGQKKPILWLSDLYSLSDDQALILHPTIESLHQLIQQNKFATAYRVRCALQDHGKDIPHDMVFVNAALGEINSLSSVTYNAFYAWLNLLPAKHTLNAGQRNPFRLFRTLHRSGVPSRDLEAILGLAKIACSKGYFFEEFKRVHAIDGAAASVQPQCAQQHASMARKVLILGCCDANHRWKRIALKLLKLSKREGIPVSPDVANLVVTPKPKAIDVAALLVPYASDTMAPHYVSG